MMDENDLEFVDEYWGEDDWIPEHPGEVEKSFPGRLVYVSGAGEEIVADEI